jgi:ATP phosphoribosyltransferase
MRDGTARRTASGSRGATSRLQLALPKGRVLTESCVVLRRLGFPPPVTRSYRHETPDHTLVVRLLKSADIPRLVATGACHLGVAGDEWIDECSEPVERVMALDWYHAKLCLAANAAWHPSADPRVVTPFPRLAKRLLGEGEHRLKISAVAGSSEAFPPDLAGAIVDCVETGATLRANGLDVRKVLLECNVQLIATPGLELGIGASEIVARTLQAFRPE